MADDDDEIGYGKPPKHTRFKKGQSGNPKGRPKGVRNLKSALREALNETVTIREGGKSKQVSIREALMKAAIAKGMSGDIRSIATIFGFDERLLGEEGSENQEKPLRPDEQGILDLHLVAAVLDQ